jgi:hypothetical protein
MRRFAYCAVWLVISTHAAAADQAATIASSAAQSATPGVLLLPVQFQAMQITLSHLDRIPEWARMGTLTVGLAFETLMDQRNDLHRVAMPTLDPPEQLVVDEHLRALTTLLDQASQLAAPPWGMQRAAFERSVGPGLAFLAARTGARYGLLFEGAQFVQVEWTSFVSPWVAHPPRPTESAARMALVDLASGQVTWLDQWNTSKLKGANGRPLTDIRDTPTARELLRQMFASYPHSKLLGN